MIKNCKIVREFELEHAPQAYSTLEERLALLDDMFIFAQKFEKQFTDYEKSPHVQMLVKMTSLFKKVGQTTVGSKQKALVADSSSDDK